MSSETDVLVIGAGIMGCVTAYHLARAGVETLVLERGEINREASGVNAGSLHFQLRWYDHPSPTRLRLVRASADQWRTVETELGCDLGVRLAGGLVVAETSDEFDGLKKKLGLEHSIGLETEVLSTREMLELAPHLSEELVGACHCPEEGFCNALLVAPAYAREAVRAGARIWARCEVLGIDRRHRKGYTVHTSAGDVVAHRVVNAAGPWAGRIGAMLDIPLSVGGSVIIMSVTEPSAIILRQLIQHATRHLTMKQAPYGTFIIGGGWPGRYIRATNQKAAGVEDVVGNLWSAVRVVPALRRLHLLRTWAGMIPITSDAEPIFGECAGADGFFVMVFPSGSAGLTVGPVVGRLMAELLTRGQTSIPMEAYDPARHVKRSF